VEQEWSCYAKTHEKIPQFTIRMNEGLLGHAKMYNMIELERNHIRGKITISAMMCIGRKHDQAE